MSSSIAGIGFSRCSTPPQAIADFWETLTESFEGETNVERVIEGEDGVLVAAHTVGRGRSGGVPLDLRWSLAFQVRGGKVSRVDVYGDRAKALKAVGLAEWAMSQANVEIVGRVLRRYGDQDIEGILTDVHPEVEIDYSDSNAPDASVYHGHAVCRVFVKGRYEDFETRSFDALELVDAPPSAVIAVGRMQGTRRASGVAVEAGSVAVWTLHDGKVTRIKLYQTRAEALKAVGLEG